MGQRQQETVKKSMITGFSVPSPPAHNQVQAGGQGGGAPGWKEGPVASAFCQQA